MTAKSSGDDPMDLGPFLQNYVMKNPFKAQEVSSTVDGRGAAAAGDRAVVRLAPRRRGSWPRLNAGMRARRLGDKACLVNGVDNNNVCAESANLLVHNDEISPGDVTAWYVDSYLPAPTCIFTWSVTSNCGDDLAALHIVFIKSRSSYGISCIKSTE